VKRAARVAAFATGTFVLCFAAVGALHAPGARRMMASLGIHCPVDTASAEQVAQVRRRGLRRVRGDRPAPARPALGMQLGRSTARDVQAWQRREGVQCDAIKRGFDYLRCRGVPAAALGETGPAISEAWFSFDASGRLVGVDAYRRGMDDRGTAIAWQEARARLETELGAPSRSLGDASPAALRASALQTARIEYRYSDYLATVTAANLPYAGLAVREQYILAQ
jgi:hypothetical protein